MISRAKCLLVIFIHAAIPFVTFAQAPNPRDNFAKPYALYSSGSLAQAKELFQQASVADCSVTAYSVYYLGLISFKEGSLDAARQFLSQLRSRYPQSIWFQPVRLPQARIYLAETKYAQVNEALRSLRAENNLNP